MEDPKNSGPEFKIGDAIKIKDDCSKIVYGEYGTVTGILTIMDKKLGEYMWLYHVTFRKDGNNEHKYDSLFFDKDELKHSAWESKLGKLL